MRSCIVVAVLQNSIWCASSKWEVSYTSEATLPLFTSAAAVVPHLSCCMVGFSKVPNSYADLLHAYMGLSGLSLMGTCLNCGTEMLAELGLTKGATWLCSVHAGKFELNPLDVDLALSSRVSAHVVVCTSKR